MGRAAFNMRVGVGHEPETTAIAVTEVGAMTPTSLKHADGKKGLEETVLVIEK